MGSGISQPNPLNHHHHHKATTATATTTTTTTNNKNDYQVGDLALTNMIGQDLIFIKEAMVEIQKYVDHMNVQINQASQKFEEPKTRGGGGEKLKKLKAQIPSKLIKI
ncbi:hypothetical protein CsSME_00043858 [Camellia sinensis var. sinensis]